MHGCVSMDNQECKTRTKIIDTNNNETTFYPFSMNVNKCDGSCNTVILIAHMRSFIFLAILKT